MKDLTYIQSRCVISPTECWEWQLSTDDFGYGRVGINGRHHKAHRVAYIANGGSIPKGLLVLHTCDNPPCCNPDHLFVGTYQDNNDDMMTKGRNKQPKGAEHKHAIFTPEQIRSIRNDPRPSYKIAIDYGCHASTVCRLKRGDTYKD